jgi:hypothetical protein
MTDYFNASRETNVLAGRGPGYPRVGMEVSTPVRMPVGQREVTVFRRV